MSEKLTDLERAESLGMTLGEFQSLVGHDGLELHPEFSEAADHLAYKDPKKKKKKKDKKADAGGIYHAQTADKNYTGDHVHTKENPLGLHAHYEGGPLGGGHRHYAQNSAGHHTHAYTLEELKEFMLHSPNGMIKMEGGHGHDGSAPDGKHDHSDETFGEEQNSSL